MSITDFPQGAPVSSAEAVARYIKRGWSPVPIPSGTKGPRLKNWQDLRLKAEDIPKYFNNSQNVGIINGPASGHLVTVDLDCDEALAVAGRFLSPTLTGGRDSKPDAHWWFICPGLEHKAFETTDDGTILELRSTDHQTVVPPSVHPTGERYRWSRSGLDAERVEPDALLDAGRRLATASLIARYLPEHKDRGGAGGRYHYALAVAGYLLRHEPGREKAVNLLKAAWDARGWLGIEKGQESAHRGIGRAVDDSAKKIARDDPAWGGRKLEEMAPGLPRKIADFMGWQRPDHREQRRHYETSDFGGKGIGMTKALADEIADEHFFAQDAGGRLYHYAEGAYKNYAERFIKLRVKRILEERNASDKWSSHRANEVIEYIRADAPELWERPPLDRVNVMNGILELSGRQLYPHTPEFLSPVQLPISYDADAKCPEWEKFVNRTFPDDARDLAFEVAADLMTPDRSIQKALLLIGEGDNGKSVYLRAIGAFVGSTNAAGVSIHKLESDRFAASRLIGKLANICPDLPSGHLEQTSVFKAITGGDALNAEYKYRESFEFVPYARLLFSANSAPRAGDASHAFFRRWLVVPFEATFTEEEKLPREVLDARLSDPKELSGVLNKALDARERLGSKGFTESRSMKEAAEEFHQMTDPVSVWLDNNTVEGAEAYVSKDALAREFNSFCQKTGKPGMNKNAFGRAVKRARNNITEAQRMVNGSKTWCWLGIALETPERPGDGPGERPARDGGADANSLLEVEGLEPDVTRNHENHEKSPTCCGNRKKSVGGGEGTIEETSRENPVIPVIPGTPEVAERVRQALEERLKTRPRLINDTPAVIAAELFIHTDLGAAPEEVEEALKRMKA
jgi:putative DNA primase/helicase